MASNLTLDAGLVNLHSKREVRHGKKMSGNATQSGISNNVGPVKLFLNTLLSFHLKEFFSSLSFFSASTTTARS
jgi:hypothetical protein